MKNTCIIIAGPTAVGKTSLAIALAKHFSTEIISADSRQCYRELNIGVAKPSLEQLAEIPHHFINSHPIHTNLSVADFACYAIDTIQTLFEKNSVVVMVGGTGLYIKAFAEGLDDIPAVDPFIRETITRKFDEEGIGYLLGEIKRLDPDFYNTGESQNPQRLIRALEVKIFTGRPIGSFQTGKKLSRNFDIVKLNLQLPREELYSRINHRVDLMMQAGLLEEAASLHRYSTLNALQTVGYKELFDYFEGLTSLEKAIELIKQNTRHYAKRQVTWFKKDAEMLPCTSTLNEVLQLLNASISN